MNTAAVLTRMISKRKLPEPPEPFEPDPPNPKLKNLYFVWEEECMNFSGLEIKLTFYHFTNIIENKIFLAKKMNKFLNVTVCSDFHRHFRRPKRVHQWLVLWIR